MNSYYPGLTRTREAAIRRSLEALRVHDEYSAVQPGALRRLMGTGLIELGRYLLKDGAKLGRAA